MDNTNNFNDPTRFLTSWAEYATDLWKEMVHHTGEADSGSKSSVEAAFETANRSWEQFFSLIKTPASRGPMMPNFDQYKNGNNNDFVQNIFLTFWEEYLRIQGNLLHANSTTGSSSEAETSNNFGARFFQMLNESFEKELMQALQIPTLGMTRFYHEKANQAFFKFIELKKALYRFAQVFSDPVDNSFKQLRKKIYETTDPDHLKDSKACYQMWIKLLEEGYKDLYQTPQYIETMTHALKSYEDFVVARNAIIEDTLKYYPIPTNREMDELYKELYQLKRRVKQLEKQLPN